MLKEIYLNCLILHFMKHTKNGKANITNLFVPDDNELLR